MITIAQDSEFMTNLLPANPVPAGKRFATFQDHNGSAAVFSLGEDAILNLIISLNGFPALLDFGSLCKFSGKVLAFDVQQNSDTTLSIVVATYASSTLCNLYVLVGMMPEKLFAPLPTDIIFAGSTYPLIFDLFLSNFTVPVGSSNFPMVFLSLAPPGSITASSQLGYLDVTAQPGGGVVFSLDTSWRLSTDPVAILAVTWGVCPVGAGAFVLYTASNGNHIQFRTFQGNEFSSEMTCPTGALCLDSYTDPVTAYTNLVVGGDVITKFDYHQYTSGSGVGTPIVTGDTALGLKDIHIAPSTNLLTIWYTTIADGVNYYSAPMAQLNSGQLIQLLEDGTGGQISTMLTAIEPNGELYVNTLLSVDQSGSLTLLQCASDTGIWQQVPFFVPSAANNMEVPSFTLRFIAKSDDPNQPVANSLLHITASGSVEAFSNGESATIDQEGRWYPADTSGVVSIIVSTADMASFTFQVDQFQAQAQTAVTITTEVLNPNAKLNAKLVSLNIKSGNDLLNAKTQTGDQLIKAGTVPQADADNAAKIINQLNALSLVAGRPSRQLKKWKNYPNIDIPLGVLPEILCGCMPKNPVAQARFLKRLSLGDWRTGWGFFPWVYQKAKDAVNWVVQKAGEVLSLIVEIGGIIYNFVLQGVEAIGKAMSWVFEKITVGVQALIDFIGFIFSWDDILTTSDSIVAVINAGLDYGQDQIAGLQAQEAAWIRGLKEDTANRVEPVTAATGSETKDPDETASMDSANNGVGYNWVSYQVTYGGMGTTSAITPASTLATEDATLQDLWNSISAILQGVEHLVTDIGQDVNDLFTPATTSTQVFARLQQQLINSALDTVQNVSDLFLTALSLALSQFRSIGNQPIEIPIFSALWKKITNGRSLTVFNAFSLLLAIPSTIIYKLVKGATPPSLVGMTKADFSAYVNGTSTKLPDGKVEAFPADAIAKLLGVVGIVMERIQTDFQTIKAIAVANTPADETIDTGMIFLGTAMAIYSWPKAGGNDMPLRWTVWFLNTSNTLALAVARFVGWKTGTPSKVTAPLTETWAVITSIPTLLIQIIIVVNGETGSIVARHIVEDTFGLLKVWLSAIATVSPDGTTKTVATAGKYLCIFIRTVMLFSDWYIGDGSMLGLHGGFIYLLPEIEENKKKGQEIKAGSDRKDLLASNVTIQEKRKKEL